MAQVSPRRTVYSFHEGWVPPPLVHSETAPRCDVCDQIIVGAPAGEGVYLWSRGEEPIYERAPLCASCALALGMTALRRFDEEEEEGG